MDQGAFPTCLQSTALYQQNDLASFKTLWADWLLLSHVNSPFVARVVYLESEEDSTDVAEISDVFRFLTEEIILRRTKGTPDGTSSLPAKRSSAPATTSALTIQLGIENFQSAQALETCTEGLNSEKEFLEVAMQMALAVRDLHRMRIINIDMNNFVLKRFCDRHGDTDVGNVCGYEYVVKLKSLGEKVVFVDGETGFEEDDEDPSLLPDVNQLISKFGTVRESMIEKGVLIPDILKSMTENGTKTIGDVIAFLESCFQEKILPLADLKARAHKWLARVYRNYFLMPNYSSLEHLVSTFKRLTAPSLNMPSLQRGNFTNERLEIHSEGKSTLNSRLADQYWNELNDIIPMKDRSGKIDLSVQPSLFKRPGAIFREQDQVSGPCQVSRHQSNTFI